MEDKQPPSSTERKRLLAEVDRLVLAQTNVFIRELLRSLGYRPGANKAEFRAGLETAIDEGTLTKEGLDAWLRSIEGWGNQHVYAFSVPDRIAEAALWASATSVERVVDPVFPGTWTAEIPPRYPKTPTVAWTGFDGDRRLLLIEWQKRADSWVRDTDEDERRRRHGDDYWLKAFRLEPGRALMRFALLLEPQAAARPIAALFVRLPVRSKEHRQAIDVAWSDLDKLVFGGRSLSTIRDSPWDLSTLIKMLDNDIVHDARPGFRSRGARFSEGLASVEFLAPPDMTLPEMIREVRLSIPQRVIDAPGFIGTKGDFQTVKDPDRATSREARVELFQEEHRIRIWTELDEADVWAILETLDGLH